MSLIHFWEIQIILGLRERWLLTMNLNGGIANPLLDDYRWAVQAFISLVQYVIGGVSSLVKHLDVFFFGRVLWCLSCHFEQLSLLHDLSKRLSRLNLSAIDHPIVHYFRIWVSLSRFNDFEFGRCVCLVDERRLNELWTLLTMNVDKARLLVTEVVNRPFTHLLTVIVLVVQMSQPLHLALWSVQESGKLCLKKMLVNGLRW